MRFRHTTQMDVYRIARYSKQGRTQQWIADKLGISTRTVRNLKKHGITEEANQRASYRSAVGIADEGTCGRTCVGRADTKGRGHPGQQKLNHRAVHAADPLDILLLEERYGIKDDRYRRTPVRIEPHNFVEPAPTVHGDTWEEYLQEFEGIVGLAVRHGKYGSKLADQGAYVSSEAVRDLRYDYGYPYRKYLKDRLIVAELSVRRRRARARDGRNYLASLDRDST